MIETIRDEHGRLYVIDGRLSTGWWFVYRVGKPAGRYDSHDEAVAAIADGDLEAGWV